MTRIDGGAGDDYLQAGDVLSRTVSVPSLVMDGQDDHLTLRTDGSDPSRWTLSLWVKLDSIGDDQFLWASGEADNNNIDSAYFRADGRLRVEHQGSQVVITDQVFATDTWYHLTFSSDTRAGASREDLMRVYVDGVEPSYMVDRRGNTLRAGEGWDSLGQSGSPLTLGRRDFHRGHYNLDGELAGVRFIDGQALPGSSFGQDVSGSWRPQDYAGGHGTGGFHLDFADGGNPGRDASGNGNHLGDPGGAATNGASDLSVNETGGVELIGGEGDDTLVGGAGNDTLIGGVGRDTVIYSGSIQDYTVSDNGDGSYSVRRNAAGAGLVIRPVAADLSAREWP